MLKIRELKIEDLDFVLENTEREGWNILKKDIIRCIRLDPKGCFVAEEDCKKIGHVFTFNYRNVGVIGMLIVRPEHRGRGIGTKLMQKAIEYLKRQGAKTIRLEAVPKAVPLYRRLGFAAEFDSLRLKKIIERKEEACENSPQEVRQIKNEDIDRIAKFDTKYFGANRLRTLKAIYMDYPRLAFLSEKNNKIIGYLMARQVKNGFWIGPWVCNPNFPEIAKQLINACIDRIRKEYEKAEVRLGIPAVNTQAVNLLRNMEFEVYSKSIRMFSGEKNLNEEIAGIYAIGGPEKG